MLKKKELGGVNKDESSEESGESREESGES